MLNRKFAVPVVLVSAVVLAGCASQITTSNSLVSTIYKVDKKELMQRYEEVILSLDNYSIRSKTNGQIVVEFAPPPRLVMGTGRVRAEFASETGIRNDGKEESGVNIVYTDITPFFSQDTSFTGADVIVQIKSALEGYLDFKKIEYHQVQITR